MVTGADGWSPTDPAVERAAAAGRLPAIAASRQDRGLAFGDKETVNALDPATPVPVRLGRRATTRVPATLARDGAIVDEGWAQEHGLGVGDRFTLTSAEGTSCR